MNSEKKSTHTHTDRIATSRAKGTNGNSYFAQQNWNKIIIFSQNYPFYCNLFINEFSIFLFLFLLFFLISSSFISKMSILNILDTYFVHIHEWFRVFQKPYKIKFSVVFLFFGNYRFVVAFCSIVFVGKPSIYQ